jgi:hypothetical protein
VEAHVTLQQQLRHVARHQEEDAMHAMQIQGGSHSAMRGVVATPRTGCNAAAQLLGAYSSTRGDTWPHTPGSQKQPS